MQCNHSTSTIECQSLVPIASGLLMQHQHLTDSSECPTLVPFESGLLMQCEQLTNSNECPTQMPITNGFDNQFECITETMEEQKLGEDSEYFDIRRYDDLITKCIHQGVDLNSYVEAYVQITKLLNRLNFLFRFVVHDVNDKLAILSFHLQSADGAEYQIIENMLDFEIQQNAGQNGTCALLRLHRAMKFINHLIKLIIRSRDADKMTSLAAKAYDDTLGHYHPRAVQKAVHAAFFTLPNKKKFLHELVRVKETKEETDQLMNSVITHATELFNIVETYFSTRETCFVLLGFFFKVRMAQNGQNHDEYFDIRGYDEFLSRCIQEGVDLAAYIDAYKEINKLLSRLNLLFLFVVHDVKQKLKVLTHHLNSDVGAHYQRIETMLDYETHLNSKQRTGTCALLILHRAMMFIIRLIQAIRISNDDAKTSDLAIKAYDETFTPYHPWVIRKAAHAAMLTLPNKHKVVVELVRMHEDREEADAVMNSVIAHGTVLFNLIEELYSNRNLLNIA